MIVDDFWAKGLKNFLGGAYPHIIRLPFPLGVSWHPRGVQYIVDPMVEELSGMKKVREDGGDGLVMDCTNVRAPYECTILFHSKQERAILVVFRVSDVQDRTDNVEDWAMSLILDHHRGLFPICAMAGVSELNQLTTLVGDKEAWRHHFTNICVKAKQRLTSDEEEIEDFRQVISAMNLKLNMDGVPYVPFDMAMTTYVTFKLLGAKNICQDVIRPAVTLQKVRKKKGKEPLFAWHELSYQGSPIRTASSTTNHSGNKLPVHWVRGHFKEYTAENPLFGSITGRFWWQPHLAGRDHDRFVEKTYVVTTEKKGN